MLKIPWEAIKVAPEIQCELTGMPDGDERDGCETFG